MSTDKQRNPAHALTLWHGIRDAADLPVPAPGTSAAERLKMIVRYGGAQSSLIVDYLIGIECPWAIVDSWRNLAALADIAPRTMLWKPKNGYVWGTEGLTLADLAHLTIMLERWAIPVDARPIVDAVLPTLKGRQLLTSAEVAVLWHKRERGRMDILRIRADMPEDERGIVETHGGYRAACHPRGLAIASPRIGKRAWADELLSIRMASRTAA